MRSPTYKKLKSLTRTFNSKERTPEEYVAFDEKITPLVETLDPAEKYWFQLSEFATQLGAKAQDWDAEITKECGSDDPQTKMAWFENYMNTVGEKLEGLLESQEQLLQEMDDLRDILDDLDDTIDEMKNRAVKPSPPTPTVH